LEFEGATKRNRPVLKPGALVYVRITSTVLDPILSCKLGPKDVGAPRKDWMTQEGLYGELKGGALQKIPLGLARELLQLPFEVCIGCNGFLWIHSPQPAFMILVANAILNSQVLTPEQTRAMVQLLIKSVQLQISNDND
jgi:exosome complex component RRP40